MASVDYSLYGTQAGLTALRAAMEARCPCRNVVVGGPDNLPVVYAPGAPGWTAQVCASAPYPSGGQYRLDVPSGVTIPVAAGKQRALVLAIGESGLAGYDYTSDWASLVPAGYPNLDGSQWKYNSTGYVPLNEYTHEVGGFGPAGVFCWHLQNHLGAGYEVGLVPCASPGTTSAQWAVGGALYQTAVQRTLAALSMPNTMLGAILHEHGVNDAYLGLSYATGWAARWTAIETTLRADLGGVTCPLVTHRMCLTRSAQGGITDASWAQILAEQDSWASARRILVQKPDGPWVEPTIKAHLLASAQVQLAQLDIDAFVAAS